MTTACADEPTFEFPDIRAESRYIEYSDWADAPLCDSLLDELDAYVEDVAEFLQVPPPPPASIRYTWVHPDAGVEDPLPCPEGAGGCAREVNGKVRVFAKVPDHSHELVHAVHLLTLPWTHALLHEGLANYLGTTDVLGPYVPDEFAREFQTLLDAERRPNTHEEYQVAMHFVGGVIERHGLETFKALWHAISPDTGASEFAAIYLELVGEPLADALLALEQHTPEPWDMVARTACDGPLLEWWDSGSRVLESSEKCLGRFNVYEPVRDHLIYALRFRTEITADSTLFVQRRGTVLDNQVYLRRCGPDSSESSVWLNDGGDVIEVSAGTYVFEVMADNPSDLMLPVELSISLWPGS